ncbi:type II toxin-antitoxin system VapC family toxin [Brevundimonas sp.]|uniref:type II toxin-antitoxin system VapC family toxin n=1 Tax=Brevundimonas sp. TaxID=1871086 RepID=UPI001D2CDAE0|nr:type II toxin-antitoxin system VapC family toxin [Brevundimonas sp.]MBL0947405.1 type II toxin-antitoxin system VapC family toxin [Brevundimonas sp.]
MRAIDTNVVVRFLTNDDPQQGAVARAVVEDGDIFLPTTVLLETEWVLRSAYNFEAAQISQALRGLAGLPGILVETPSSLAQALEWMERGMDFADALHLSGSERCTAFLTFDRRLGDRAGTLTSPPVQRL